MISLEFPVVTMRTFLSAARKVDFHNNQNNNENHINATRLSKSTLSRSPFQDSSSNVMMRVPPSKPPLTSKSGNHNMPIQNGTPRPLMPTLSAAAANKTPSRAAPSKLPNNITPRSGSRKSRVDSTNTTPTSTANNEPLRLAHDPRPTVSFSPAVSENGYKSASSSDSKFFFASDARPGQPPPRPNLPPKSSSSTFLYANGEPIPPPLRSPPGSVTGSAIGEERSTPKFFHANGTPDLAASPYFPPPRPSSVLSSASRTASPRIGTLSPGGTTSPIQRPASPSKFSQYAPLSSRNTPSLPSPAARPPPIGRGNSAGGIVSARRASIEAQKTHGRTPSGDTKGPPARKISGGSSQELSAPLSPLNLVTTSLPTTTPEEAGPQDDVPEAPSPIKAGHSIEKMNELAAEARRERKVLDLEITNSSLEAINRTLEREMRKVTAELRRYRRLSRSGRLSIADSTSRASSGALTIDVANGVLLSDMSEEEEEEEEEEDEETEISEDDSPDERSLSPNAMAENDLKHRKRDEKRLQLDLSKHQQLLIDSQKMNQSLKRCLGWSESMINEGKKALEYRVKITDVELGGRVLAPDEVWEVVVLVLHRWRKRISSRYLTQIYIHSLIQLD